MRLIDFGPDQRELTLRCFPAEDKDHRLHSGPDGSAVLADWFAGGMISFQARPLPTLSEVPSRANAATDYAAIFARWCPVFLLFTGVSFLV